MKNYFSKNLYLQGLRKIRTAGITMAIIILALNALVPIVCMLESQPIFPGQERTIEIIENSVFAPVGGPLVVLFAPILTYLMFSYLNERKASDFYHALPQKRVCVFISFTAAILTWILATLVASAILNGILWAVARYYTTTFFAGFVSTVAYFITALTLVGFMALAMTLTGTAIANVLVFLLFTLFIRTFGLFFLYALEDIAPMFNITNSWLSIFDITFFLPFRVFLFSENTLADAKLLIYWTIVGILLLVGACVAYHYRKSETATKSAPSRRMQHIYRIGVTFPFMMMMMFMILLDENLESYHFIFFVFAALVWITYEILTTKKIKNVIRSLPLFLIPVLLSLGYIGSVYLARTVIYNTTPKREAIVSVQMENSYGRYFNKWSDIIIYTHSIDDAEILDMIPKALEETKETLHMTTEEYRKKGYTNYDTVTLTLKSGRKVTYDLQSHFNFDEIFINSDDLHTLCFQLPPEEFTQNIYLEPTISSLNDQSIWEAFCEDYNNMTEQEKISYLTWNYNGNYNTSYLYVVGEYQGCYFHISYNLDPKYTPKAYARFISAYNQTHPPFSGLENAKDILNLIDDPENHFTSIEIIGANGSVYSDNFNVVKEFLNQIQIDKHLTSYGNKNQIYEVRLFIDTNYKTEYYDAKATIYSKPSTYYYVHEVYYITLSDADMQTYYAIEKQYKNMQKTYETDTIVVH